MICLYRGVSALSRAIQWRTWSPYSHAAWLNDDYSVYEAWGKGGVTRSAHFSQRHTAGTRIDLFEVNLSAGELLGVQDFLSRQVGKKYDWRGIAGFISRRDQSQRQSAWFCSELVFAAFLHIHKPLLCRIEPWRVAPGDLALSPLLVENGSVLCGKTRRDEHEKVRSIVDGDVHFA